MTINRVAGVAFAIFALAVAVEAQKLALGTTASPGPGFFPFVLAALLLATSVVLLASTLYPSQQPEESTESLADGGHVWALVVTVSALVLFLILFPTLGLAAAAIGFLAILFCLDGMNWSRVIALACTIGIGTELACRAMKIPLPSPWIVDVFQAGT